MPDEILAAPEYLPTPEYETIRYRDLDLRKAAKALARKEETRIRKQLGASRQSAIKSAKKRITHLESEVEKLGESKAELLGYIGEIANLQSWLKRLQDEKDDANNERDFILMNLLNQKAAAEEEKAVPTLFAKPITANTVLENIWFVRSFIAGAILVGAASLLIYSLYFKAIFDSVGRVVSYYPWSWETVWTSASGANGLYTLSAGVSLLLIGICLVALVFFIPELLRSLVSESIESGVPSKQPQ